jgi:Na+/H+ antiporter NhaD/arsenite permease-like protein
VLARLFDESEERWLMGGGVVIAANAGGAWTPIGDVTTTMLWIGGQVSTTSLMQYLFLPSIACFAAAFYLLSRQIHETIDMKSIHPAKEKREPYSTLIFCLGLASLIMVPVLKVYTGMPPFLGILLGVGLMWLVTDLVHEKYEDRSHLRVPHVLTKIDMSGVLFFLGILLAIEALDSAGIMASLAHFLDRTIQQSGVIAIFIGLASSVVDNVPLVAAAMSMYHLSVFPMDDPFWELIAYCAGTGGSILIIGSAAGVVYMGLEKVSFNWYLKRITLPAAVGYFAGIAIYFLLR